MNQDREMIVMAVLEGQLPESMLTQKEVDQVVLLAQEAVMLNKMDELEQQGYNVFWGVDGGDSTH
jgi:hypothetical protein